MTDVVFPSRPSAHGVRTPEFPTPDPTPIRPQNESIAPGGGGSSSLEVVVLRPSIRPPSYDEVVASTASPARFSAAASSMPRGGGLGFPSSADNTMMMSDKRALPSPMATPAANYGQNNNTVNSSLWDGGSNDTSAVTTGTDFPRGNNNNNNNNNSNSTSRAQPAALNESNSSQKHQQPQHEQTQHSPGGRSRKLACWYADRTKGDDAIPTLRYRTIGDTVKGCLASNDSRPLTNQELKVDWKRICALRSGHQLYKLCPSYIDRDEFADPLRDVVGLDGKSTGKAKVLIPCGYTTRERKDGKWDVTPRGVRPTARENTTVALKPTETDPLQEKVQLQGSPMKSGGDAGAGGSSNNNNASRRLLHAGNTADSFQASTGGKITDRTPADDRALRVASAVPLNRPPANPLIDEADRRLQQNGFGGLATVSRASDEAVSHLLKFCGFPDAERLSILWEVRKAQRAPARVI